MKIRHWCKYCIRVHQSCDFTFQSVWVLVRLVILTSGHHMSPVCLGRARYCCMMRKAGRSTCTSIRPPLVHSPRSGNCTVHEVSAVIVTCTCMTLRMAQLYYKKTSTHPHTRHQLRERRAPGVAATRAPHSMLVQ